MRTIWYLAGGAFIGILPEVVTGPAYSLQFIALLLGILAVQFLAWHLTRALWRLGQARKLIPQPRAAVFEEWIDCVAGTALDDTDEIYLSPELIGEVIDTPTHIFITSGLTAITLPKRALENPAEMVTHLRQLSKGPYYFDP